MKLGFYTKYFSTIFRGLTMTSWKERFESRKLVFLLKREDYDLYKKIKEKVAEHRVTSALEDLNKLIKEVQQSAEYAEKLLFNALTVDNQILKNERLIIEHLKELSKAVGKNKVLKDLERELALSIYEGTKLAEAQDREEYKLILLILDESENSHKGFMEAIRLRFQKEITQTTLARFAIRMEINREKKDIKVLEKVAIDIKKLTDTIKYARKKEEDLKGELEKDYIRVRDALKDAFYNSYMIKKRDIMMILKILFNLNNLRKFLIIWSEEHNLPRSNVQSLLNDIEKIESWIAKNMRPIAQGMRIIINGIAGIEKEAFAQASQ